MNISQQNIEKRNEGINEENEGIKKQLFNTLTDRYFNIKDFEQDGKIYENFGIKTWKKIVLNTAGKIIPKSASSYYLQSGSIEDIKNNY